jgi:hypothetical protein
VSLEAETSLGVCEALELGFVDEHDLLALVIIILGFHENLGASTSGSEVSFRASICVVRVSPVFLDFFFFFELLLFLFFLILGLYEGRFLLGGYRSAMSPCGYGGSDFKFGKMILVLLELRLLLDYWFRRFQNDWTVLTRGLCHGSDRVPLCLWAREG